MTVVVRRKQLVRDQVRVAYGAVPISLEALPADDPFRAAIRERARSLLVELGYLTCEELGTLPVKNAIAAALARLRDEIGRTDQGRAPGLEDGQLAWHLGPCERFATAILALRLAIPGTYPRIERSQWSPVMDAQRWLILAVVVVVVAVIVYGRSVQTRDRREQARRISVQAQDKAHSAAEAISQREDRRLAGMSEDDRAWEQASLQRHRVSQQRTRTGEVPANHETYH